MFRWSVDASHKHGSTPLWLSHCISSNNKQNLCTDTIYVVVSLLLDRICTTIYNQSCRRTYFWYIPSGVTIMFYQFHIDLLTLIWTLIFLKHILPGKLFRSIEVFGHPINTSLLDKIAGMIYFLISNNNIIFRVTKCILILLNQELIVWLVAVIVL